MFEEADNFADVFRGSLPYYLLLALPILIICSASPVLASSEFTVHRMTQFDINGVPHGCRASSVSLEAKSLYTWSTSRHCVVAKFEDMTIDQFREIRQKAGALVLLLPANVTSMSTEEKEHLNLLERAMLVQSISIPVYFSPYNAELDKIISEITHTSASSASSNENKSQGSQRASALQELVSSISGNGYQIIVTGASHAASKASRIPVIQGELVPNKYVKPLEGGVDINNKLPLILVTAHLDTFGLYNEYPLNADAALLMVIAELFSKMYNTPNAAPKYRLMFLLSESGNLLNFQGAKKWLDENVQLQNVDFVLCLDTITQALNGEEKRLYMHVSKPPKDNSPVNNFFKLLKAVAAKYNNVTIEGVHKKINLADQQLAWEHERFSMKRLPAFTLSSVKLPNHPMRTTIFKDSEEKILSLTKNKAKIISEALARYIYNITASKENGEEVDIFFGAMQVNTRLIKSYLKLRSALQNNDLKNAFGKYLKNVKIIYDKPDAREPDFMLYDGTQANLNVYRVKPAVFDLFLTILICAYLSSVYFVIQHFPVFYAIVCKMSKAQVSSQFNQHHTERSKSKVN